MNKCTACKYNSDIWCYRPHIHSGLPLINHLCNNERQDPVIKQQDKCGIDGKYWEPKPESRIKKWARWLKQLHTKSK